MSCEPLVLRGPAAGAARPVVFGQEPDRDEQLATGLWADTYAEVRAAAYDAGYRDGLARGRHDGTTQGRIEVTARSASALRALDVAADRLARIEATTAGDLAPRVVDLALELAELILQREQRASAEPAREALARALPLLPERGPVAARLHPDDLATLDPVDELLPGRPVTVIADPTLAPGDAVVDVGPTRVESRLRDALRRVAAALGGQEVEP